MDSRTITEVLNKLIGPTEPTGETKIDYRRFDNLKKLIDVTDWCLDALTCSAEHRHVVLQDTIRENAETAYSAIEEIKNWCEEVLEENK